MAKKKRPASVDQILSTVDPTKSHLTKAQLQLIGDALDKETRELIERDLKEYESRILRPSRQLAELSKKLPPSEARSMISSLPGFSARDVEIPGLRFPPEFRQLWEVNLRERCFFSMEIGPSLEIKPAPTAAVIPNELSVRPTDPARRVKSSIAFAEPKQGMFFVGAGAGPAPEYSASTQRLFTSGSISTATIINPIPLPPITERTLVDVEVTFKVGRNGPHPLSVVAYEPERLTQREFVGVRGDAFVRLVGDVVGFPPALKQHTFLDHHPNPNPQGQPIPPMISTEQFTIRTFSEYPRIGGLAVWVTVSLMAFVEGGGTRTLTSADGFSGVDFASFISGNVIMTSQVPHGPIEVPRITVKLCEPGPHKSPFGLP